MYYINLRRASIERMHLTMSKLTNEKNYINFVINGPLLL